MKKAALVIVLSLAPLSFPCFAQEADVEQQSGAAMIREAENGVEILENVVKEVQTALTNAQLESDVTRIDYLNSLLVNARGYLSVVQNGTINLKDAVARNDVEAQEHHYKIIQMAVSKGKEILERLAETASGNLGISGTTVSESTRSCSVEPCLGGEEFFEPSKADALGKSVESGSELDIDASAYL